MSTFLLILLVIIAGGMAIDKCFLTINQALQSKKISEYDYELYGPSVPILWETKTVVTATCIEKRTDPHPLDTGKYIHYLLFLQEDGMRKSLAVRDEEPYALTLVGDIGVLTYSDKHFISFEL